MTRLEYNRKILKYLWDNKEFNDIMNDNIGNYEDMIGCYQAMENSIELYPQQRFGQLFCNYWGGDYRSDNPSKLTTDLQNYLFPGKYDPFFEESAETYYRLVGPPEELKKEFEEKKGKQVFFEYKDKTIRGELTGLEFNPYNLTWQWLINDGEYYINTNKSITLL